MTKMEKSADHLLLQNRAWVEQKNNEDDQFFQRLVAAQKPDFLWIGCSDSRVPANEITGTAPGEVFVHRNIANMVVHTDMSMLSVLDYSVNVLQVKHVIVCGHYGCGGVLAAMSDNSIGLIDNWIRHIKDVYRYHKHELDSIADVKLRQNKFIELNVIEQVCDLSETSIIQNAWSRGESPTIHGWVYDIANGLINDLKVSMNCEEDRLEVNELLEKNMR